MSQKSDVIIWACHPRHRSHICFSGHCDLVVRKRQSWYWRSFRKGKTELATVVSSQGRDSTRYCRLVLAISSITSTKGHVLRFFIISMTTKMAWKQGLSTRGPYVSTLPVPKIYSPSNGSWSFWAGCCRVKWRSWTSPVEPSWRGKAVIRWLIVSHGHNQKSSKLTSSWSLSERSRLKSVKRGTAIVAFILLLTHQVFDSNPTREVSFRIESLYLWSSLVPNERLYRQGRELSSSHQRRNSKWTRQSRSSLSCKGSKAETFGLMWTSSVWSCLRANFTGGFQKLHRRIETEAAPRILYERRDETTSPLRIFGSLVW